ncbi:MAG: FkbM family methyltransferase [Oscillospiraceae bacterium]|nr:FkbM family methyltransferase [Oscillospiraceae bacterium]
MMIHNNIRYAVNEKESLWVKLENSVKRILLYGMGDGAEKVLKCLSERGIKLAGIFASDDFVRGQSFCGYKVLTLFEAEQIYGDFTVLVCFATKINEVMEHIESIASRHELYFPDVNIYGDPSQVFDENYFENNELRLQRVFDALADENSRDFFVSLISYKMSGKIGYIHQLDNYSFKIKDKIKRIGVFADIGAYNGDTAIKAAKDFPDLHSILAFEPELHSYKRLYEEFENNPLLSHKKSLLINAAASDKNGVSTFCTGEGMGSYVKDNIYNRGVQKKRKEKTVKTETLDGIIENYPDFIPDLIKFDAEGAEYEAIKGCSAIIKQHCPILEVSCYHKKDDIFIIPETVWEINPEYKLYITRSNVCFPDWECEYVFIH